LTFLEGSINEITSRPKAIHDTHSDERALTDATVDRDIANYDAHATFAT